jgi:putative methyltransferase
MRHVIQQVDAELSHESRSIEVAEPERAYPTVLVGGHRRRAYFNEFNVRMGKMSYLPLVSGILRAYAETSEAVRANYEFQPFLYYIDSLTTILGKYRDPDVACFSVSMWNEQLNLAVASEVKRRWPHTLILFGGPQVPYGSEYFERHPFIDITVKGEGEEPFLDVLHRFIEETEDFDGIPGVTWRDRKNGRIVVNEGERAFKRDLDQYPSPYLEGLYDDLLAAQDENLEFQAIIETNRGCPFPCTFCFWGRGGLTRKYRYHGMDRVFAEIDWCGRNSIRYVFNADSNFGMNRRDREIAEFIVATKQKYGYPDKFRTCFGKNTDEKIYEIGALFTKHALEKGITLARQSNDEQTLKNIRRDNIKMSTFRYLQERFNDLNIPIYTELILGLPGETVESWKRGIDELLEAGLRNQLFIYLLQVYPNTEMGDPDYQERFGIQTQRLALNEIHGSQRDASWITEYEDVVVRTDSMSLDEWRQMVKLSWVTMVLHSMKIGFYVLVYLLSRLKLRASDLIGFISEERMPEGTGQMLRSELREYDRLIALMLDEGAGRGTILPEYGGCYWDVEEASFLRLSENLDAFYAEFLDVLKAFLNEQGVAYDATELEEVVRYQRARMPSCVPSNMTAYEFTRNLPEYFETAFSSTPAALAPVRQRLELHPKDFGGDKERFARETILWGRKSGTMLVTGDYVTLSTQAVDPRSK